jgi:hypothetical protein
MAVWTKPRPPTRKPEFTPPGQAIAAGAMSVNEARGHWVGATTPKLITQTAQCGYCGRYGKTLSQCEGCGAHEHELKALRRQVTRRA